MRIVLPFGFYGAGNTGDEATLHGFALLLARSGARANVWSGSRNPAHTARVEPAFSYFATRSHDPRRWWAKYRATAYAVVGGTPIQDVLGDWPFNELTPHVRSTDRRKVPLAFIASGVEILQCGGKRRMLAEEYAPRVRHWSVRSDRGRQRLTEYGVPPDRISVTADLAWLIDPVTTDFGRGRLQRLGISPDQTLIGVNVANENAVFDKNPRMTEALASALDTLAAEMKAKVIFLANDVREEAGFDKAAALAVIAKMKHPEQAILVPNEYFSPRQMMSIIGCCSLTMSMRYHFCLFSVLQKVPFIAIQRTDKVLDFCWDMDWKATVVPPQFEAGEVIEQARDLRSNAQSVDHHLVETARKMRDRAMMNISALNTLRTPV